MDGIFLVNKPAGITSQDVLTRIKRATGLRKLGHAGTLDPAATGLLVVLFGKATRLQALLLASSKTYEGVIRLGIGTDTDDFTGKVIHEDSRLAFSADGDLETVVAKLATEFLGPQFQVPPAVSAIKVQGQRSYRLARKGIVVNHEPRAVRVEELTLKFMSPERLAYRARVSAGTYVRALARDIGARLGSYACAESICRLESGQFLLSDALELDAIRSVEDVSRRLIPISALGLPTLTLGSEECDQLRQGRQHPLALRERVESSGLRSCGREVIAIVDPQGSFQGLADRPLGRSGPNQERWSVRFLM